MFSRPKILFLVSLLFVALLNSIPTYLFEFLIFYQSSNYAMSIIFLINITITSKYSRDTNICSVLAYFSIIKEITVCMVQNFDG